jgi:hypothetical protein
MRSRSAPNVPTPPLCLRAKETVPPLQCRRPHIPCQSGRAHPSSNGTLHYPLFWVICLLLPNSRASTSTIRQQRQQDHKLAANGSGLQLTSLAGSTGTRTVGSTKAGSDSVFRINLPRPRRARARARGAAVRAIPRFAADANKATSLRPKILDSCICARCLRLQTMYHCLR